MDIFESCQQHYVYTSKNLKILHITECRVEILKFKCRNITPEKFSPITGKTNNILKYVKNQNPLNLQNFKQKLFCVVLRACTAEKSLLRLARKLRLAVSRNTSFYRKGVILQLHCR